MLRGKHIWIIPLISAVLVAIVGRWANGKIRVVIHQELKEELQSTLDANVTALEIWMSNQKRIASSLVEEPRLRALSLQILGEAEPAGQNRMALNDLSRELIAKEKLQERVRTLGFGVAQLVNTNHVVVADTTRARGRLGSTVPDELHPRYDELFATGEPIIVTPFKLQPRGERGRPPRRGDFRPPSGAESGAPRFNDPERRRSFRQRGSWRDRDFTVMQVAAPLKDTNGVTQGALALIINPDAEFTRILSVARTGESGETFAFDPEGVMISESRFDEALKQFGLLAAAPDAHSALALQLNDPGGDLTRGFRFATNADLPLIRMVELALDGTAGVELDPFRDYRGVPVIGAWRWLPDYGFGVATKIDASEAYRPLRVVRGVFLILFLLLVLASVLIFLYSYTQVIWRRRLTEAELKVRQLGQYQLVEKIGEGGMDVVYKARHALLRRETALKLLPPEKSDPEAVQRFEQEVRLTCRLTHPNTIQVYDYGHTPDDIFYYAMEYLDGLNLGELVVRSGPQPEGRVIHVLRQICDSLHEAHELGLIHRDIKPANVFLCNRGGMPDCVKVLDFGLVKPFRPVEESLAEVTVQTRDGIVGTPNFIAPESIESPEASDVRSDIYSVGVLGYYLLTGQCLFEAGTFAEVSRKHVAKNPDTPSVKLGRAISPELEKLVMRCLSKHPGERPQSSSEMSAMLAACPQSTEWTREQQLAWWVEYRRALAKESDSSQPRKPSSFEPSVNIAFSDRTI